MQTPNNLNSKWKQDQLQLAYFFHIMKGPHSSLLTGEDQKTVSDTFRSIVHRNMAYFFGANLGSFLIFVVANRNTQSFGKLFFLKGITAVTLPGFLVSTLFNLNNNNHLRIRMYQTAYRYDFNRPEFQKSLEDYRKPL